MEIGMFTYRDKSTVRCQRQVPISVVQTNLPNILDIYISHWQMHISENSRKLYVADLANDVHCNFPPEALMNTVSSYEAAYWLKRISYNFLIWGCCQLPIMVPRFFRLTYKFSYKSAHAWSSASPFAYQAR